MAINFPSSPIDNQVYTENESSWYYSTSASAWLGVPPTLTSTDPVVVGTIVENVFTITDGASVNIDPTNGSIQLWTLTASRTPILPTSWSSGQAVTLMINDGTAYTITWTTMGVVWVGGSAPPLALTGYSIIELWKVGTTIYGAYVGDVA